MAASRGTLKEWAATYLRAFYGETQLLRNVIGVLERISKTPPQKTKKEGGGELPAGKLEGEARGRPRPLP